MSRFYFILVLLCSGFFSANLIAQKGYQIDFQIEAYAAQEVYLAYFYGDKQILKDTIVATKNQQFSIRGTSPLTAGVYMLVLAPDQKRIQFIVPEEDQHFSVRMDTSTQVSRIHFEGSEANELYYDFLTKKEKQAQALEAFEKTTQKEGTTLDTTRRAQLLAEQVAFQAEQVALVKKYPETILAALIGMSWEIEVPSFTGSPAEEIAFVQQYHQYHYFDHTPLYASFFLRLPGGYQKVDYFINGLSPAGISPLSLKYPEAIKSALTIVLDKMQENRKVFKFYLTHFINKYGNAKIVGMDAVFVHLVENYVLSGAADWVKGASLNTVKKLASKRKPLLNGKVAPNITMQLESGESIALHDVEAAYTILVFWRPNCGHCKKAIPAIQSFYEAHRAEGVKVFAPCTWIQDKTPQCWSDAKEKGMEDFINVVDPKMKSKFLSLYDIQTTPRVFLLDKDKRILIKRIASEELENIFQKIKSLP
ncbi:MAG: redoxin domain-containing protein [Saprospiraceae bacterium]